MEIISNILNTFQTLKLDVSETIRFMDRMDAKFMCSTQALPEILEKLKVHYKLLQFKNQSIRDYKTLYYDTKDLQLYLNHHNGHLNRYKIRYRNYADSNHGFLEVKFKTNKGRTLKERLKQDQPAMPWNPEALNFIKEKTPGDPLLLQPSLWINFQRVTFIANDFKERITLDLNLEFLSGSVQKNVERLIIIEVKQISKQKTPVFEILKQLHIKQTALSKYCFGVTQVYPQMKKNNFKATLNTLNKLIHDTSFNTDSGN